MDSSIHDGEVVVRYFLAGDRCYFSSVEVVFLGCKISFSDREIDDWALFIVYMFSLDSSSELYLRCSVEFEPADSFTDIFFKIEKAVIFISCSVYSFFNVVFDFLRDYIFCIAFA